MRTFFIGLIASLSASLANAQSLERSVVSNAGAELTAGGIQLEYTVGEAAVGSWAKGNIQIDQGFNQGMKKQSGSIDRNVLPSLKVFPNPSTNEFRIAGSDISSLRVYDLNGKILLDVGSSSMNVLDASNWEQGVYNLTVVHSNGAMQTKRLVKL